MRNLELRNKWLSSDYQRNHLAFLMYQQIRRIAFSDEIKVSKKKYYESNKTEINKRTNERRKLLGHKKTEADNIRDNANRRKWRANNKELFLKQKREYRYGEFASVVELLNELKQELSDGKETCGTKG